VIFITPDNPPKLDEGSWLFVVLRGVGTPCRVEEPPEEVYKYTYYVYYVYVYVIAKVMITLHVCIRVTM